MKLEPAASAAETKPDTSAPSTEPRRPILGLTTQEAVRLAFRAFGYACLTLALVLGGYLAWLWWGTDWLNSRSQHQLRGDIDRRIAAARTHGTSSGTPLRIAVPPVLEGHAVAILRIPKIHVDDVVVEGTDSGDLAKGPGHYQSTAYPWDAVGRVGIAGHRTTYGRPFWSLDRIGKGDSISLLTEYGLFRYTVYRTKSVLPTSTWVLQQTATPTLVLTTCTPRFSASHRLAVFASRVAAQWFQPPEQQQAVQGSGP
jgi:sortase A